ncbi:MAG: mechanosensitive ion channel family protein [Actinomycetota bacterium]
MPIALSDGILEWLRTSGVRIGVVIVLAVVLSRIGSLAVRRLRGRMEGDPAATAQLTLQRTTTLVQTLAAAIRAAVWTIAVLLVLGQVGLDIGPLIAGAGVIGVALGFGAQSLVKDFLSGFFILLENQFSVGDQVALSTIGGAVTGRVELMTLRSTWIRSREGTIHAVPNGNVTLVANRSRGEGLLDLDLKIPAGEDVERVTARLEELFTEVAEDPDVGHLSAPPSIDGVEAMGDDMVLRITARVRPSRRDEVERELRRRIAQRFVPASDHVTVEGA